MKEYSKNQEQEAHVWGVGDEGREDRSVWLEETILGGLLRHLWRNLSSGLKPGHVTELPPQNLIPQGQPPHTVTEDCLPALLPRCVSLLDHGAGFSTVCPSVPS